ncbi:MAG: class II aldolase/adducin family protein [Coriobacteriales bacterium]|nr:class II aldolase/adducin family protein [Coriobacteriales bacterium]
MADFDFEKFKQDFIDGASSAAGSVADAMRSIGDDTGRIKQFHETGHYLEHHDLISVTGGNLSVSDGSNIWITRSGSKLGFLTPADIVTCAFTENDTDANAGTHNVSTDARPHASVELNVHRAMYHACARIVSADAANSWAVVHAHPLNTIALTLNADFMTPLDEEGLLYLGSSVPVLSAKDSIGSNEVATLVANVVSGGGRIAIVRGHGSFAIATTLALALQMTVALERSARIILASKFAKRKAVCDA